MKARSSSDRHKEVRILSSRKMTWLSSNGNWADMATKFRHTFTDITGCGAIRGMIVAITIASIAALNVASVEARKIRTKHSIPKISSKSESKDNSEKNASISASSDSVAFYNRICPAIRFYGFDKTVGSSLESFFISNELDSAINAMEITITYSDMKGRQIHKRNLRLECDVPPHETIRTDIKSWDSQKSFYFYQSAKPKRQATPFKAKIELNSVEFKNNAVKK